MGRPEGKIVVVTGTNSGIGLATATRFALEGARLFMTGRRQAELNDAVKAVGGNARSVRGAVSDMADLDRLHEMVRLEAGAIDVLFANAGGGAFEPLGDITVDH